MILKRELQGSLGTLLLDALMLEVSPWMVILSFLGLRPQ